MKNLTLIIILALFSIACNQAPSRTSSTDSLTRMSPETSSADSLKYIDSIMSADKSSALSQDGKDQLQALKETVIDSTDFKELYKSLRIKKDEFSDNVFLFDKTSPMYVNRNGIYAYIGGGKSTNPVLHFAIQYCADDWLFIRTMTFNCDGENFDYIPSEFKTDNGDGGIWEWSDDSISSEEIKMLNKIATSKSVKVKYIGRQYYKIVQVSKAQQLALKKILQIHKGLLLGYKA